MRFSEEELKKLNDAFEGQHPRESIRWALKTFKPEIAMTSSFGAESACLLHLATQEDPDLSVRFIDTGFLFPETHTFRETLTREMKLNVQTFKTEMDVEQFKKDHADLPIEDPAYCCGEFKVKATERALEGLKCWMTGIRRSQSQTRADTPIIEVLQNGLVKVAPLAVWSAKQVYYYMQENKLPYHPLWYEGYTSIGCYPCTRKPTDPSDPRSGRWAGEDKTECGIHDIGKLGPDT